MEVKILKGNIVESQVDTIICNLFEGVEIPGGATGAIDQALGGSIRDLVKLGDLTGKIGEAVVVYTRGAITAKRVIVAGLGRADEINQEYIRKASAAAIKKARELNAVNVATIVHGAGIGGIIPALAAQATLEGILLALYKFDAPGVKSPEKPHKIEALTVVEYDGSKLDKIRTGVELAKAVSAGVYLARELVNLPANYATPTHMAEIAQDIAENHGMKITVGDREWATQNKMGAYLAVAKGAGEPPKFIILEHNGDRHDLDTIVLVGKGITFDTGGISIKPSEKMEEMKADMSGAAAVLGAMKAVGLLNLPLRVIGITPCTENMPDASAYRPADIITASNGITIEIISTDAEGRMILADALVYAKRFQPKAVVDLATLTGACVIALGKGVAAGLFSNDEKLQSKVVASGNNTHERVWPMPLWEDYKTNIKSNVADLKNSGGRFGGVGTSAIFLKEFTDYPWAHIDMAGMMLADKDDGYVPAGGVGYGVRLVVDLLLNW